MNEELTLPLRVGEIEQLIPHRYPFLLVDMVTGFERMQWIEGRKNTTINEPFFQGHFPGRPVMPGVLMVEALAQLGAIFAKLCRAESRDKLVVFSGIEKLRFRRLVLPGDVLTLKMSLIKSKFGAWKMQGEVRVGDDLAVDGILVASEIG